MLLPGCEPGDDVDLAVTTHDDFVCPLTQESQHAEISAINTMSGLAAHVLGGDSDGQPQDSAADRVPVYEHVHTRAEFAGSKRLGVSCFCTFVE